MKISALLSVSALFADGILAINCKDGLNYCGRSIKLKVPNYEEEDFQDKDLVYCQQTGDTLRRVETCYAGCIEAPAGQSDYCAPFAGFIVTSATETCVKLADGIHKDSVERGEKKSKSVAKLWLAEADFGYASAMTACLLLSGAENKGKDGEAAWQQAFDFFKDATVRFQKELREVKKEQKD